MTTIRAIDFSSTKYDLFVTGPCEVTFSVDSNQMKIFRNAYAINCHLDFVLRIDGCSSRYFVKHVLSVSADSMPHSSTREIPHWITVTCANITELHDPVMWP